MKIFLLSLLCMFSAIVLSAEYPQWKTYTNDQLITAVGGNDKVLWIATSTGIMRINRSTGSRIFFGQAAPNPFHASTIIEYTIPVGNTVPVRLAVYGMLGHEVALLVNEPKAAAIIKHSSMQSIFPAASTPTACRREDEARRSE